MSKIIIVLLSVLLMLSIDITHKQSNHISELETLNNKLTKELNNTVEAVITVLETYEYQERKLQDLSFCESSNRSNIINISDGVGGRDSYGMYQIQFRTAQYQYQKWGYDLSFEEFRLLALDPLWSKEFARRTIFDDGYGNWWSCYEG